MTTKVGKLERELRPLGKGAFWRLTAEPHVLIRVRRVLAKVKKSAGAIYVNDSPESCVDLRWICQRWDLDLSDGDRAYLEGRATAEDERIASFVHVLDGTIAPPELQTAIPLRPYQAQAVELVRRSRGLVVGDDVGLGKTWIAIGLLSDPAARPAVVVTMTYLPGQWKAELERVLPGIRVHIAGKGTAYDLLGKDRGRKGRDFRIPQTRQEAEQFPDVIVLGYSRLSGWADALGKVCKTVIFDELHELRTGPGTLRYDGAQKLAARMVYRLGLTATPVFGYGSEMHHLVNITSPDALGSHEEFSREWCNDKKITDPSTFGTYLRTSGLYIRRTRPEVGRELPPLTVVPVHLTIEDDAIREVVGVAADLARRILDRTTGREERWRASGELDWRLRQATGIAKASAVAQFVELLVRQDGPVLLGGWHRAVYDLWIEFFERSLLRCALFTGSETAIEKAEAARRFQAGELDVLIMSLRAGAGLDGLQYSACRNIVIGELDWSPQVHRQFIGRVDRDGQTSTLTAYYMLADSGSDPIVVDVLGIKRQQAAGIEDPANTDLVPVSDPRRARDLARAYLLSIGQEVPEELPDDVLDAEDIGVAPEPPQEASGFTLTP